MIALGNIEGLHAHAHELHAFCPRCRQWRQLDLARLILAGCPSR